MTITSPTADPATTVDRAVHHARRHGGRRRRRAVGHVGRTIAAAAARRSGTTSWTATDIPLRSGVNVITVTAQDASGNRASDTLTVTVGQLTYILAEGATGSFFDLDVLVANPTTRSAPVVVDVPQGQRHDGDAEPHRRTPLSQLTIQVDQIPGLEAVGGVSTVITSTNAVPLVVERTMFWDSQYFGSHGGTAVDGPRTRWLFAEGSQGFFSTFVLLANPSARRRR